MSYLNSKLYQLCRRSLSEKKIFGKFEKYQFKEIKQETNSLVKQNEGKRLLFICIQADTIDEKSNSPLWVIASTNDQESAPVYDVDELYESACQLTPGLDLSTEPLRPLMFLIEDLLRDLVKRILNHLPLHDSFQDTLNKVFSLTETLFYNSSKTVIFIKADRNDDNSLYVHLKAMWGEEGEKVGTLL